MKTMYMHTLDGSPARYEENEQVCFLNHRGKFIGKLVPSLKRIRYEHEKSQAWRVKQGFPENDNLGYIRVEVE